MPQTAPTFESLPAPEKLKLMAYGDGIAPFEGYVFDFDLAIPRWIPGEGVEDAYLGRNFDEPKRVPMAPIARIGLPAPEVPGVIYLLIDGPTTRLGAYLSLPRAERDMALIKKAMGVNNNLEIIEMPLES